MSFVSVENLVIGSGPGGAVTAFELAQSGREVMILEEGRSLSLESSPHFSASEMEAKYNHGGLTVAFGNPKITYVEGRVTGGGSEVNSGLYHRTPDIILDQWRKEFDLQESSAVDLEPHFLEIEKQLSVSLSTQTPPASLRLKAGAEKLGWQVVDVPRWYKGDQKQSMSMTYLKKAMEFGAMLKSQIRVVRLKRKNQAWVVESCEQGHQRKSYFAKNVFVCGGAIRTPFLLRCSGVGNHLVGKSLSMHPSVKLLAMFDEPVNEIGQGVATHQVKEFSPEIGFGCSISSPGYVALTTIDEPTHRQEFMSQWRNCAIYYAMTLGNENGKVLKLPFFQSPFVKYALTKREVSSLRKGFKRLTECAFAGGANTVLPNAVGVGRMLTSNYKDRLTAYDQLAAKDMRVMTVHLFSSCPMGESATNTVVNSYGQVRGEHNLWVADGSMLCSALGVNPQGSIMSFARRNISKHLHNLNRSQI